MTLLVAAAAGLVLVIRQWRAHQRQRFITTLRQEWGSRVLRAPDFTALRAGCASRLASVRDAAALDERTWNDLHLDAVFDELDRTTSTVGQQALYYRLRTAATAAGLSDFEAIVTRMATDQPTRERAQFALARLQDPHGYHVWNLASEESLTLSRWHVLCPLLAAASASVAVATVLWHGVLPWLGAMLIVDVVARLSVLRSVTTVGIVVRQIAPLVATAEELTFLATGKLESIAALKRDVAGLRRLKTIARWLSGDPLMVSFSWDPIARLGGALLRAVYELLDILLLLDGSGAYFAARSLRTHGRALSRVVEALGEVDAAISVAWWRKERVDWTQPRFVDTGAALVIDSARHPLVRRAVPNSVTVPSGHGILVTGSNMSGKSTFVRTVGVNTVLAQTINTCLAVRYEAPAFAVRSCIDREDDLEGGKSYYLVEVDAMLDLVRASQIERPHLFLCDELFRGTNSLERIAAAEAVLNELLIDGEHRKPHAVFVATHDDELVDLLSGSYEACHFAERVGPDGLSFDFVIRPGRATTRNAIALLASRGAPSALVERATRLAADIDRRRAS